MIEGATMLRTADDILDAMKARKEALGLSDALVDDLAGYAPGRWSKMAGPTREKMPTLATFMLFADVLGLSIVLVEDPAKVRRVRSRWERRSARAVHPGGAVSAVSIKRARPIVLREAARKAANARWAGSTPETRAAFTKMLNRAREVKRHARMSEAA